MSIELTNLEASRMYELLAESEKLRARVAELERVLAYAGWLLKDFDGFCLGERLTAMGDYHNSPLQGMALDCSRRIKSVLGKGE